MRELLLRLLQLASGVSCTSIPRVRLLYPSDLTSVSLVSFAWIQAIFRLGPVSFFILCTRLYHIILLHSMVPILLIQYTQLVLQFIVVSETRLEVSSEDPVLKQSFASSSD